MTRLALEIGGLVFAILIVLAASRGLSTIAPGVASALRLVVHPAVLGGIVLGGLVLRSRARRPNTEAPREPRSGS